MMGKQNFSRLQVAGFGLKRKKGSYLNQTVVHIVLIGLIFAVFFMAIAGKVNGRDVKQQVLEKQIALLIDSSESGMSYDVRKANINGIVSGVKIENGRVFVVVDGLSSVKGYPYFSKYSVSVVEEDSKFVVKVL